MKKIILLLIIIYIVLFSNIIVAQNQPPCNLLEATQFDFWLGNWQGVYSDTLQPVYNKIDKPLGNCVVKENFSDPNTQFKGKSVSVFNTKTKKWQQTWVDNAGGYIVLIGEFKDHKMQLNSEQIKPDGKKVLQRMIYYNITNESFDWNWEQSIDEGKVWTVSWKIHYNRVN